MKGVYNPKAFFPHAVSLRQAFAHCAKFPTAASRRSLDRVSVPVWPIDLSVRLPVLALVSRYLTNKLIGHRPLLRRRDCSQLLSLGISPRNHIRYCARFPGSIPILRAGYLCITHPFATKLWLSTCRSRLRAITPFDLHVLGAPPAFVLSQDQTLNLKIDLRAYFLVIKEQS